MEFADVEAHREAVEDRLVTVVERATPEELSDRMADAVLSGGKRVRPTLTLVVCEAVGGDPTTDTALDFAAGIELVHTASLVVDDIIDRSQVRRGVPSVWATDGHSAAIVTSNGLLGEAFALFAADPRATEAVADALVELGEGEASELVAHPSDESAYMELARRKTGALFRASAELGAIAADADAHTIQRVGEYAERVGIAFQLRDDVLDRTGDAEQLGKPAGRDAELDRPSVLQVTDRSPADVADLARSEADAARASLERLELADTDAQAALLDLTEFVVSRNR